MVTSLLLIVHTAELSSEDGDEVVLDEIVARVNSEIITMTDLDKWLEDLRKALMEEFRDSKKREKEFQKQKRGILKRMIEEKLMLQFAEDLGFGGGVDTDIDAYLAELLKERGIPNLEILDQGLRQVGSSLAEYREKLRDQFILRNLMGQMVYSKITLMTPEIEAYYQENIDRFTLLPELELAEILFLTEEKIKAEVQEKAERVLTDLQGGSAFEELAKRYSDGPTASKGGHIGSFKKGSMTPVLEQILWELEPGQITGIVEVEFGLQIVRVLSKKGSRHIPLEEVRDDIKMALYTRRAQPKVEEFLAELRRESYVYISPKYKEQYEPLAEPAAEIR